MQNYKFKNLKIGLSASFEKKITSNLIKNFIKISGDNNAIHTDSKFAKKYNYKKNIGHGMILAIYYSKFIGKFLPGKYSLIISTDLKFHKPFFANDKLKFFGKIIHLNKLYRVVTLFIKASNQEKKLISTCFANIKLHE